MNNPFNPSFDYNNTSFISDNSVLNNVIESVHNTNSRWRTTFIMGMRGAGKTSLLTFLSKNLSKQPDVIQLMLSSTEELLDNVMAGIERELPSSLKIKGVGVNVPGVSLNIDSKEKKSTFQYDTEDLLRLAEHSGKTIVLLLDEVQNITPQLRTLFSSYRSYRSLGLPIIIIAAGLPSTVDSVINDKALTFLLRSNQVVLKPLDLTTIGSSYIRLFKNRGLSVQQAINMADASAGYPYMYQLLGDYVWENAGNPIKDSDIDDAILWAKVALYRNVYMKVMTDLAPNARELVLAIRKYGGVDVTTKDLRESMDWTLNQVTTYKAVLNHWGITEKTGYGLISFKMPYFNDFIDQNYD